MRVPVPVVVMVAIAFKLWLWWRTLPPGAHHVICIVGLWLALAVLFGARMSIE